ncbi:unnamed protein product, partial [Rhizoctonia solani]
MTLSHLEEPNGGGLGSHKIIAPSPATNSDPNGASQASRYRQRTDTLPSRARKRPLDAALSESWKLLKLRQCSICLETMDSSLWIRPSTLCTHEPKSCEPCFAKYVVHAIEEGLTEILCPEVECRKRMEYADVEIRLRGDEERLNRYSSLVAQKELERHPNFVWCTNERCGKGQIHNQGDTTPLVVCHHCHTYICFVHRVPWHGNLTCDQYSKHEIENKASEEYINTHMKRCPNMGCKRPIEKIDGCDHMTCFRPGGCGHEFCWICLADYGLILREGNHKHTPNCPHFPRVVPRNTEDPSTLPWTPELRRPRRRVCCRGRWAVLGIPVIDREDESPPARRRDAMLRPPSPICSTPVAPYPLALTPHPEAVNLLTKADTPFLHHAPWPRSLVRGCYLEAGPSHFSDAPIETEATLSTRTGTGCNPLEIGESSITAAVHQAETPHTNFTQRQRSELYQPPPPRSCQSTSFAQPTPQRR